MISRRCVPQLAMSGGLARSLVAVTAALALCVPLLAHPRTAQAAFSWFGPVSLDPTDQSLPGLAILDAVACPSNTQCTAVGWSGDETTFNPMSPQDRSASPISALHVIGIDCPSDQQCTAVDASGRVMTFNPVAPRTSLQASNVDRGASGKSPQPKGISCPSTDQCTIFDAWGVVTFDPNEPGSPRVNGVDSEGPIYAGTCVTPSQCTVVDTYVDGDFGAIGATTFNPSDTGDASDPYPVDSGYHALPSGGSAVNADPTSVSCPTTTFCFMIDSRQWGNSFNPHSMGSTGPPSPIEDDRDAEPEAVVCAGTYLCTFVDQFGEEHSFGSAVDQKNSFACLPFAVVGGCFATEPTALACPSVTFCVAVDEEGNEISYDPVYPPTPKLAPIEGGNLLTGIACPATSQCTAVDGGGQEMTFSPTQPPSSPAPVPIDTDGLTSIACAGKAQCTAVEGEGNEITFNPVNPAQRTSASLTHDSLTSITCTSRSQCVATSLTGTEITFNPASPGAATSAYVDSTGFLTGVACAEVPPQNKRPQPALPLPFANYDCTVVDSNGAEVTFSLGNPSSRSSAVVDGRWLNAVACVNFEECVAVDRAGQEVTFDPVLPSITATATMAERGTPVTGITCLARTSCVAVDEEGRAWEGDPSVSGPWTEDSVLPGDALTGVACPSAGECVTVDALGRGFVGGVPVQLPKYRRPAVSGARQSATVWRATNKPPSLQTQPVKAAVVVRSTAPKGTVFSFRLNQPAHVTVLFVRGKKHPTALPFWAPAGEEKLHFYGFIPGSGRLKPGQYRAMLVVTNVAGQWSKSSELNFRIVS